MTSLILITVFCIVIAIGAPIGTSMGISSLVTLSIEKLGYTMIPYLYYSAVSKYLLLSIPFFILAGNIMEKAGISIKLIDFAQSLVGHKKGGLALVCVIVACFFAAISGSGPATVAALGGIVIPAMTKAGYKKGDAAALMASAGGLGIIIPPSISFVIFSSIAGVSTGKLFMAGIVPGLLMGAALFIASLWVSRKSSLESQPRSSARQRWQAFKGAFWGLLMPVIILGGIYGGIFTPTEAAAVSAVYGLFVGVVIYKTIGWKEVLAIFRDTGKLIGRIMWTVGCAAIMVFVLSVSGISTAASNLIIQVSHGHTFIFLIIFNIIILIAGCFIDGNSSMFIFLPVFLPVALKLGYDPIALGVVMTMNIAIGQVTPPVGTNLYVACGIANINVREIIGPSLPYVISSTFVLLLITYIPQIITFLPNLMGL
jgi:C4-dicarboxylate transporter DctM subunit